MDALRTLGPAPKTAIRTNKAGERFPQWIYTRRRSWSIVRVYFKPNGMFDHQEYDR